MDRKEFFRNSLVASACAGCFLLPSTSLMASESLVSETEDEKYKQLLQEKEFIQNWLTDLLETIDENLDEFKSQVENCIDLPQPGSNRGYSPVSIIESFLVSIWCGANRFMHTEVTRHDEALKKIFGWKQSPAQDVYKRFSSGWLYVEFKRPF